jgi:hypothetical protein
MPKVFVISVLFSLQIVWAQQSSERGRTVSDTQLQRQVGQEAFERWALDPDGPKKKAQARRQAEAMDEFNSRATHFVELWRAFASELKYKKTFNAKLAKQISKAFHDLEKSDGWPVRAAR